MRELKRYIFTGIFFISFASLTAQDYILRKLDLSISSADYDEIAPCVTSDGQTLYFTRLRHPQFERTLIEGGVNLFDALDSSDYLKRLGNIYQQLGQEPITDPVHSAFNQDIWIARSVDGVLNMLEHPDYPINNALPNSVAALTPKDEPIVVNQFAPNGGMQKGFSIVKRKADGVWGFPEPVGIDRYHNSGADVNLSISSDGQIMILSMEREDSYGVSDLYICQLKADGTWTYPENLGRGVNSPYRESTPHLSKDMRTIYFSSDRTYPGRGCDIYMQERIGEGWKRWSSPRKFRSPINSNGDDSHPYFNEATGRLYFTSDRDGTFDIFCIQIKEPEPLQVLPQKEIVIATKKEVIPELSIGAKLECNDIFFLQSEAIILEESYYELTRIVYLLKQQPNLAIRVAGHTDNVGDAELLMKLSIDRAVAIKTYLVEKGEIDSGRIVTVGFGGTRPLNDNSTEALRAKNRRVEIEVIKHPKMAGFDYGTH
jgi:outer membrane protein OmpA-like peptidoglycan-associated protein